MVIEGDCVWIPNLLYQFSKVVVFEDEEDEAPMVYRSIFDHPPEVMGRIIYVDRESSCVHVVVDDC